MDYYAEKAQKELERRKEHAELLAEEWANIKRFKTKDGKDFAVMANNFKNKDGEKCIFAKASWSDGEQEIKVFAHGAKCGYADDWLTITPTVYSGSKEAEHYKETGQLVERGQNLHPYAKLTADEVEKLIAERIEYWQGCIKEYSTALEHFEEYSSKVIKMRDEARAYIETLPAHYQFREIFEGR